MGLSEDSPFQTPLYSLPFASYNSPWYIIRVSHSKSLESEKLFQSPLCVSMFHICYACAALRQHWLAKTHSKRLHLERLFGRKIKQSLGALSHQASPLCLCIITSLGILRN